MTRSSSDEVGSWAGPKRLNASSRQLELPAPATSEPRKEKNPIDRISLDQANAVIAAAFAEGRRLKLKPLGIAVVDAGGHLISFQRENGATSLRVQMALGKASGALGLGVSSRKLADMAAERPVFVAALSELAPNGVVPSAGGVIVEDAEGQPIGAVGVSGDLPDNDEHCALTGVSTAGLRAQS